MSVNNSSSSTEIQPAIVESTQAAATQIINQDVKNDESTQTATSDANNHHITHDSTKAATTQITDSVSDPSATKVDSNHGDSSPPTTQFPDSDATTCDPGGSSPPEAQPTTQTSHSDADKPSPPDADATMTSTHNHSDTQTLDSDANKPSPPEVQPTTQTPTHSEANKPSPPEVQPTTQTPTHSEANKPSPPEVQPTTQTPTHSYANKPSPPEVQPITQTPMHSEANKPSPPEVQPTTQTPTHSEANRPSPPEVQPNSQTPTHSEANKPSPPEVQPTNQTPDSSPPEAQPTTAPETSTAQVPDSDANKQASANSSPPTTHDTTETSTTKNVVDHAFDDPATATSSSPKIKPSDQEIIQADPEIHHATDPPTQTVNNDVPPADPTPDQERKHLVNLIDQELNFVRNICPKLGKHEARIRNEADQANNIYIKLRDEPCELKELKDLKKIVTKLKLQIPAKYRTYDENDPQKNQQADGSAGSGGPIPAKLLKRMPQLHNNLFHDSPFCKTIQQRYNDLKPELKLCVLCFSVFPENAKISRRLMVYWWIGEGLVPPEEEIGVAKTAEDIANEYFNDLIDKDFIEPVSRRDGRNVPICKMHPLVRAALVKIADNIKFFDFDKYGNPKDFGKFDEIETPEEMPAIYPLGDPREFFDFYNEKHEVTQENIAFVDSNGNPTPFADLAQIPQNPNPNPAPPPLDRNGKQIDTSKKHYFYRKKKITTRSYRICLMGSGLSKGLPWEKLHMLFNVKDDILEFKPEWFQRMRNINVVFLGRWQSSATHHIEVEEFKFEECLERMNHLKFFSLQGVSRISELPKSISNLENLLILDLRACHNLEKLPKTIGSLKCLTHLDMSDCYLLEHMPKEISSLESLQVIKGFVVVDTPGRHACTLHDLSKLQNLKKLSMYTHIKDFPQESDLDALQRFEMLRKLTIAWGGHESKIKTDKQPDAEHKKKDNLASQVMKLIPKKQWVRGYLRRMDAFNNSTLGSRLQKLDLKCFPESVTPIWLTPDRLKGLEKLYIRGGQFSDLGQFQDSHEWDAESIQVKETWNVKVLRLKYLDELEMDWRELQGLFPELSSLEKVKCPKLTLFPCDESGVWTKKTTMNT